MDERPLAPPFDRYARQVAMGARPDWYAARRFAMQRRVGREIRSGTRRADVVLFGDSMMEYWTRAGHGRETCGTGFGTRSIANFGTGGDTFLNAIWRMAHGLFDGFAPNAVVMCVGGADVGETGIERPAMAAKRIGILTTLLREVMPATPVLACGIFYRRTEPEYVAFTAEVNRLLEAACGGTLTFVPPFLTPSDAGDTRYFWDGIHFTRHAYEQWGRALRPLLDRVAPAAPNSVPTIAPSVFEDEAIRRIHSLRKALRLG
ncbi:MAG: hypothetical protein JO180_01430 [Gemmatirosa sp.]|nr:hypothetical protein [Gemmatirosa sp.]